MIVSATCSGGYAGVTRSYCIDTASVADGPAVAALVAAAFASATQAGRTGTPLGAVEASAGADLQQWSITVDDGGRAQTVTFAEDGAAALAWRPLLARLRGAAGRP